jgi:hypothetical protein
MAKSDTGERRGSTGKVYALLGFIPMSFGWAFRAM